MTVVEEFLATLAKSELLTNDQLDAAVKLSAKAPDAKALARYLIKQEQLTSWQAGQLLAGRHRLTLGKYKRLERLGRGGMGSVYLAEHTQMHRQVALKTLSSRYRDNPEKLKLFLDEARKVAALDHGNIIRAYDVDVDGDDYFLVMEYVQGQDLQERVDKEGRLDFETAAEYIRQAADGLGHAHGRGMVHCDIKPGNLLIDGNDTVKILDLGMARLHDPQSHGGKSNGDAAAEDGMLGTIDYIAPEQAQDKVDHRSDIYSLGCTLYFLLTGHPPFPEGSAREKLMQHAMREPADIQQERPDAPRTLVRICNKMMAKDPDERYQSSERLGEALAEWLEEQSNPASEKTPRRGIPANRVAPGHGSGSRPVPRSVAAMAAGAKRKRRVPANGRPADESGDDVAAPEEAAEAADTAETNEFAVDTGVDSVAGMMRSKSSHRVTRKPAGDAGDDGSDDGDSKEPYVYKRRKQSPGLFLGIVSVVGIIVVVAAFLMTRDNETSDKAADDDQTVAEKEGDTAGGEAEDATNDENDDEVLVIDESGELVEPEKKDDQPDEAPADDENDPGKTDEPALKPREPAETEDDPELPLKDKDKKKTESPPKKAPTPPKKAPTPPKKAPTPEPDPEPFKTFVGNVDLPVWDPDNAAGAGPVLLTKVDPGEAKLNVVLQGGETAYKFGSFALIRGNNQTWNLALTPARGDSSPVGVVSYGEGELRFAWDKAAPKEANYVRNTVLEVYVGREKRPLFLRKPVETPAITTFLAAKDRRKMNVEHKLAWMPHPEVMKITIPAFVGQENFQVKPDKVVDLNPKTPIAVVFGMATKPDVAMFIVGSKVSATEIDLTVTPEAATSVPGINAVLNKRGGGWEALPGLLQQAAQGIPQLSEAVRQAQGQQKQMLETQLAAAQKAQFEVQFLNGLASAVNEKGKIHYRIFAAVGSNYEIDLVTTNPPAPQQQAAN